MATYALHTLYSMRGAIEGTKGSDLTPTRILYPTAGEETRSVASIAIQPLRNSYRPTTLVYPGIDKTSLKLEGPFLYDEQAFWLSAAVTGGLSGSGGTDGKTWPFLPNATTDNVKALTLQYGWVGGATLWKLNYCQVDKYAIKFEKGKELTWSAELVSPKAPVEIGSFTGSLTDLVHVGAVGTLWQTYIDTTTIGSTADAAVISADWELDKGVTVTYPANATGVGVDVVRPKAENWKLTLTRLYTTNAERVLYASKTERKIRLKVTGPAIGSGTYVFQLDCYGYIDDISWAEVDGVMTEKMTILPVYDSTATSDYVISLINSIAAIT
jgi:hypothetical protein